MEADPKPTKERVALFDADELIDIILNIDNLYVQSVKKLRLDINGLLVDESLHHLSRSLLAVHLRLFNYTLYFLREELSALENLSILAALTVLTHEAKNRELLSKAAKSDH